MILLTVAMSMLSFILGSLTMFVIIKLPTKSELIATATYQEDKNGNEIKRPVFDMTKFIKDSNKAK